MSSVTVEKVPSLRGEITVPGDKSISHRAVMFGALSEGDTEIAHFLESADCLSTISCFRKMGIETDIQKSASGEVVTVHGKGLHGLRKPDSVLDAGNSGTTTRLLSGILAGQPFSSEIDGDDSLRTRPMKRVMTPLREMGADVSSASEKGTLPLFFHMKQNGGSSNSEKKNEWPHEDNGSAGASPEGMSAAVSEASSARQLHAITYRSPVASAQVKSCVLLAGLYADGVTTVVEPTLSRNHTELMLSGFGAEIASGRNTDGSFWSSVKPEPLLSGQKVFVPGDISSAAYFLAAGALVPGSEILLRNVGVNPTRAGIITVLKDMGADLTLLNKRAEGGEATADILIRSSALHGTEVSGDIIPSLIDELPVVAAIAPYAEGTTVIRDARELRVKESDRIAVMTETLRAMGADIEELEDGMIIHSGAPLHGATVDSHLDHRIAMSLAIAALAADGQTVINGADCVRISYPTFYDDLRKLAGQG